MTQTWDDANGRVYVAEEATGIARRADWAALPLRAMLGFGFMYHGFPKIFDPAQNEQFGAMLGSLGVPLPQVMAWLVGILEFFGGLALILGLFVVPIALLGIVNMLVAMFLLHLDAGFSFMNIVGMTPEGAPQYGVPGFEVNLLYIAGFLALLLAGAGPLSIDAAVQRRNVHKAEKLRHGGSRHVGMGTAPDDSTTR